MGSEGFRFRVLKGFYMGSKGFMMRLRVRCPIVPYETFGSFSSAAGGLLSCLAL